MRYCLCVSVGITVLIVAVIAATGSALARPMLSISTGNGPDQARTHIVRRFVDRVLDRRADRMGGDHHFGGDHRFHGETHRDRDVLAALIQGEVAMAVPGVSPPATVRVIAGLQA